MRAWIALVLILGLPATAQSEPRSAAGVTIVADVADVERLKHALERSLADVMPHSKILSCDIVVRSNEEAGQDEIYGASCLVSTGEPKPLRLLMCDDMMVGKFTLTSQYFWGTPPLDTIGAFVRSNCPAGG